MTVAACSQCVYGQGFLDSSNTVRLCRYSAPYLYTVQNTYYGVYRLWPQVQDTDWCGQGVAVTTNEKFFSVK